MLKISGEQMQALGLVSHRAYVDGLVQHFAATYPPPGEQQEWMDAGLKDLHQRILRGIGRAERHGFETEVEQFDYLVCVMELGEEFEQNPQYPWADAILNDKKGANRSRRLVDSMYIEVKISSSRR